LEIIQLIKLPNFSIKKKNYRIIVEYYWWYIIKDILIIIIYNLYVVFLSTNIYEDKKKRLNYNNIK